MRIKGFITNLGKYNEGELIGKWITFPVDDDDLQEALQRIGCYYEDEEGNAHNEQYEEYFFTDWECDFEHGFGEYENVEEVNEIAEQIEEWDEDTFNAACEYWGVKYIIDADPDDYILYSDINDDYDLGYYWIVESGCYNLESMGNLSNYIDYEAFGRDVDLEADGGFTSYGWIERR
jgi:antirestriction protein